MTNSITSGLKDEMKIKKKTIKINEEKNYIGKNSKRIKNIHKTPQKSGRIEDLTDKEIINQETPMIDIPSQPNFHKMPKRFGTIPVDKLPTGCDKEEQYKKVYPIIRLPFQETCRVKFGGSNNNPNRLIWGDNLHVLRMIPTSSVDLIYIDPPFFSGAEYNIVFGDQNEKRSFSDIWEGGMHSYLIWLNSRLLEMKRLLKPTGSIYVHLDYHASHYVKVEMDKIFGYDNFRNEIVWKRATGSKIKNPTKRSLDKSTDIILFYSKSDKHLLNPVYVKPENHEDNFPYVDEDGRKFKTVQLVGGAAAVAKMGKNQFYEYKSFKPKYGWFYIKSELQKLDDRGYIHWGKKGTPRRKMYFDEHMGNEIGNLWDDINMVTSTSTEKIGYPTQKPEALLERIIKTSSNEGDVVADFFCGGGTTPTVAQKLKRRWLACDQSRVAVSVTQARLETLYEHNKEKSKDHAAQTILSPMNDIQVQYWGTYDILMLEKYSENDFRKFVIEAYGGIVGSGSKHIHGSKNKIPIFVGSPKQNKAVTKDDVLEFAEEIQKTKGKNNGIMLAWSFLPSAKIAVEKLDTSNMNIGMIKISVHKISSPEFKKHITSHEGYSNLLTFILSPNVELQYERLSSLKYRFDARGSRAINSMAKIVNIQWDFNYQGRFTPTQGFAYGRQTNKERLAPLDVVEYEFERMGSTTIACRVQDDLGGEKMKIIELEVK